MSFQTLGRNCLHQRRGSNKHSMSSRVKLVYNIASYSTGLIHMILKWIFTFYELAKFFMLKR